MPKTKTIKITEETYRRINAYVGELRKELKRPVSTDEALRYLLAEIKKNKPSDFAGGWEISDNELEEFKNTLKEVWKSWEL